MKRLLSLILIAAMMLGLCGFGAAFAEGPKDRKLIAGGTLEPKGEAEEPDAVPGGIGEEAEEEAEAVAEGAETLAEEAEEEAEELAEETEPSSEEEPAEDGETVWEDVFSDWNEGAPALGVLTEYVEAVTDETSPDYIPPADRIAVFDMDGTIYGDRFPTDLEYYMLAWRILKDPTITPDEEMLAFGRELRESVIRGEFASDMPLRYAVQEARAYAGMSLSEFAQYATGILIRDADGFEGMVYGTAFYLPMIQVVEYLQDNDFKVYVCSGTDRLICRTLLEGMLDVPPENIIGMDDVLAASGQGDEDGLNYVFQPTDELVRTDRLLTTNLKTDKVLQIAQEIGRQPVLSFGNSSGDVSMHMYTLSNNYYRSEAFMLVADDDLRDYGDPEEAEKLGKEWEELGFHVISMKEDFRTIYGEGVVKTGSYRWAEELAEDRLPLENSPDWVARLGEAQNTEQLFVIAGVGETTATVSMHEKDSRGEWRQIMTTPGYIGLNGLGKEMEGDGKTPVGVFSFNAAFGIAEDPGCTLGYHQVTEDDYWSGDVRKGYGYNEMVSIRDLPDLNTEESEHLIDYTVPYQYCLNISYNEGGKPGLGSAIFLHCMDAARPFTHGCVAIPTEQMRLVMQHVRPDCVVVIDSLENISPETMEKWGVKSIREVEIDYGDSELYSQADMDAAIALIREEFSGWEGCRLYNVRYAGDECCTEENLAWMNDLMDGQDFTECIEFLSDFRSPKDAAGAWEPDVDYTGWQWWLARARGGDWQLLTWGY